MLQEETYSHDFQHDFIGRDVNTFWHGVRPIKLMWVNEISLVLLSVGGGCNVSFRLSFVYLRIFLSITHVCPSDHFKVFHQMFMCIRHLFKRFQRLWILLQKCKLGLFKCIFRLFNIQRKNSLIFITSKMQNLFEPHNVFLKLFRVCNCKLSPFHDCDGMNEPASFDVLGTNCVYYFNWDAFEQLYFDFEHFVIFVFFEDLFKFENDVIPLFVKASCHNLHCNLFLFHQSSNNVKSLCVIHNFD